MVDRPLRARYCASAVTALPTFPRAVLVASLAVLACKPAATEAPAIDTSLPAASPVARAKAEPPPQGPPVVVYGYFRVPNASRLLQQLAQMLPPSQAAALDENTLRMGLQMALGERDALARHAVLDRPMGCVMTSRKLDDAPLACVLGYDGGLSQLVEDLGSEGYVTGGTDYAAYAFEGQSLYLAAMGQHVAIAMAPQLIAATRDRLQRDIIDAPSGPEALVFSAYPEAIFADAEPEIAEALDAMGSALPPSEPSSKPMAEIQRRQLMSFGELQRADLWLDIDDAQGRVRLGYRGTARSGTPTAEAYAAQRGVGSTLDLELLGQLPERAIMVAGMRLDATDMMEDPMLGAYVKAASEEGTLGTSAAMAELMRENMALWRTLSTGQAAAALVHERGTKGGLVLAYRLPAGIDAMTQMQKLYAGYTKIPEQEQEPVRFGFRKGAFRSGKIRGDRVIMTPSPKALAQPSWAALAKALGGSLRIELVYAQRGDVLYTAIAPRGVDRYLERALATAGGKTNLGAREGALELLRAHADDTMLVATSIDATMAWLRAVGATERPSPVERDRLDDVVLSMRSDGELERELVIELASELVESLLRLLTL